jgi:hypothetical protein
LRRQLVLLCAALKKQGCAGLEHPVSAILQEERFAGQRHGYQKPTVPRHRDKFTGTEINAIGTRIYSARNQCIALARGTRYRRYTPTQ